MALARFAPRRPLGRTGYLATVVGIGDVADRSQPKERLVALLRRTLDAGINVVDTAPSYEDGYSEEIVGDAVRPIRDRVFVVDKIDHFDRPVSEQVRGSLSRLGLASVDAFVFHGVSEMAAWTHLASGPMRDLAEHVRRGEARFRGISTHHPEVALAAIDSGLCDVLMLPIGPYADARYEREVLPRARARGVGTLGFKTFGAGKLLADTEGYGRPLAEGRDLPRLGARECVHYTMTIDPDVVVIGMSDEAEQDAALAAAADFAPLDAAAMEDVRARAAIAIKGKGRVWWNPSGA